MMEREICIKHEGKIYKGEREIRKLVAKIYREAYDTNPNWQLAVLVIKRDDDGAIIIETEPITPSMDYRLRKDMDSPSIIALRINPLTLDPFEDLYWDDETGTWRDSEGNEFDEEEVLDEYFYWVAQDATDNFIRAVLETLEAIEEWKRKH